MISRFDLIRICHGERPETVDDIPECYKELMKKCWHDNPDEQPNTATIIRVIEKWLDVISENDDSVWHRSDKNQVVGELSANKSQPIHPQAIYTSRLFPSYEGPLYSSFDSCEEFRIHN